MLANARERTAAQYTFATNPLNRTGTDGIPGFILIRDWRFPFTNTSGIPLARNGPTPSGVDLAATLPRAVVSPGQPIVRTQNFPAGALENILTVPDPANPNRFAPATFTPTGDLVPYDVGQVLRGFSDAVLGPALAADTFAIGGDGINLGGSAQVTSELKRVVAYGAARHELTDSVRLFAQGDYYHGEGRELVNQPTFTAPTFGGDSGPVAVQTDNLFLTGAQQATINAAHIRAGVDAVRAPDGRIVRRSRLRGKAERRSTTRPPPSAWRTAARPSPRWGCRRTTTSSRTSSPPRSPA